MEWLKRLAFHPHALSVARSLRDEPERWRSSGGYLVHDCGAVRVWQRNRSFGLLIEQGGDLVWGDVTLLSTLRLSLSHHLVHHAIKAWEKQSGISLAALLKPKPIDTQPGETL